MTDILNNRKFTIDLLDWYNKNNYDFPWRKTCDPYSIWLSEVMLQQTRVSTVLPYYRRWLSSLPDIRSVAEEDFDNILKLWEGLGYYNRARNFYESCKLLVEKYEAKIPTDPLEFLKLPGVGPYICAAVMSIAFNLPFPAIDGNAIRVVSRLNSINTSFPGSKNSINAFLTALIDQNKPGIFNQAIMDLGREICFSKRPLCSICPISNYCEANVNNTVGKYPVKIKTRSRPHYKVAVGMIWKNNKFLISKRKELGLLGGLWELPGGKIRPGEGGEGCLVREIKEKLNVVVEPGVFIKQIKHAYSHFSISMYAFECFIKAGRPKAVGCADYHWIYPFQVEKFAFHSAIHKLFNLFEVRASV